MCTLQGRMKRNTEAMLILYRESAKTGDDSGIQVTEDLTHGLKGDDESQVADCKEENRDNKDRRKQEVKYVMV